MKPLSATDALRCLREGNRRFVSSIRRRSPIAMEVTEAGLGAPQEPFAVVLGCSDSRVPVELVLGQGMGDLFVIRVAGNVVAASQIGSVEFAAERFGTRLVVVLGHSECGAVTAAVEELLQPSIMRSPNLRAIVDRVRPTVEPLLASFRSDPAALVEHAVRANITNAVSDLRDGSEILKQMIASGRLTIIGAEYSLRTGSVEFFDGAGEAR